MIDKKRIAEEAEHFFEWPDPTNKNQVTLTSCLMFAGVISEMVRAEERERCASLCESIAEVADCTLVKARKDAAINTAKSCANLIRKTEGRS